MKCSPKRIISTRGTRVPRTHNSPLECWDCEEYSAFFTYPSSQIKNIFKCSYWIFTDLFLVISPGRAQCGDYLDRFSFVLGSIGWFKICRDIYIGPKPMPVLYKGLEYRGFWYLHRLGSNALWRLRDDLQKGHTAG